MKNVFFALAFMLVGTFAFADNSVKDKFINEDNLSTTTNTEISINDSLMSKIEINELAFDICTITVSIYQNGELISSATWTDNTGDCEMAEAGATMMAWSLCWCR